jgi:hypothetical protein
MSDLAKSQLHKSFRIRLYITTHNDGFIRLDRMGFVGAEYYDREGIEGRLARLISLFPEITAGLLYVDENDNYFLPGSDQLSKEIKYYKKIGFAKVIADLPYEPISDSDKRKANFYSPYEDELIGWRPCSKSSYLDLESEVAAGVDSLSNNSMNPKKRSKGSE